MLHLPDCSKDGETGEDAQGHEEGYGMYAAGEIMGERQNADEQRLPSLENDKEHDAQGYAGGRPPARQADGTVGQVSHHPLRKAIVFHLHLSCRPEELFQ